MPFFRNRHREALMEMFHPMSDADRQLSMHLMGMMYSHEPDVRRKGYWLMSHAWFDELAAKFTDRMKPHMETLYGLPIKLDKDAGFPVFVVPAPTKAPEPEWSGVLPSEVNAAARAIEGTVNFRAEFAPTLSVDEIHPAAVIFARVALMTRPSHGSRCGITGQEIHDRLLQYLTSRGR